MKCFSSILSVVLSVFLLVSCGTDLYLDQPVPAKINMGHGSKVCVTSSFSRYSPELVSQVEKRLINSGFYTVANSPAWADSVLHLDLDVYRDRTYDSDDHRDNKKDKKHHSSSSDRYNVHLTCRAVWRDGSVLGVKTYSDYYYGKKNFPASSLAREITNDLIPHMGSYSVNIDTSSEKPLLEQAANACKAGNWSQGESIALQYVSQTNDPEGYFLLGVIARKSGNESKADNYFRQAASLAPGTSKYARELERGNELRNRRQMMDAQTGE